MGCHDFVRKDPLDGGQLREILSHPDHAPTNEPSS